MHIRITDNNRNTTYEVLCDVCGLSIDLDEDCDYLTQRNGVIREANLAHRSCARIPGRFQNCWSRMMKPRWIIQQMAERARNPVITDLIDRLKEEQKERLKKFSG